jgi:hypothetical protein
LRLTAFGDAQQVGLPVLSDGSHGPAQGRAQAIGDLGVELQRLVRAVQFFALQCSAWAAAIGHRVSSSNNNAYFRYENLVTKQKIVSVCQSGVRATLLPIPIGTHEPDVRVNQLAAVDRQLKWYNLMALYR